MTSDHIALSPDELEQVAALRNEYIRERTGSLPPGRIYPYQTGYGDFCLHGYNNEISQPKYHTGGKTFRLMDLPREIRDQIYKKLVNSLIDVDVSKELSFSVCRPKPPVGYLTETYEFSVCPPTLTESSKNPGRQHSYLVTAKGSATNSVDNAEDIRNLSNTNSIIRTELAMALWSRTSIHMDCRHFDLFESFLKERPAIWNGIKSLHLDLDFTEYGEHERFVEICKMVSMILRLEKLRLDVKMKNEDVMEFFRIEKAPDWVLEFEKLRLDVKMENEDVMKLYRVDEAPDWAEAIRRLPVSSCFELNLAIEEDCSLFGETLDKDTFEKPMEAELCPYSLRPKEKETGRVSRLRTWMKS